MEGELQIKFLQSKKYLQDFKEFTFILPSVSVGNVGQLSVDIILISLDFEKVGILHHPALLPIVGYDPYNSKLDDVSTAADLHVNKHQKLLALQIRSPLLKDLQYCFLKDLSTWIKNVGVKDIIILGSCYAHLRYDYQLSGSQFRYLTNSLKHPQMENLKSSGCLELEEREDEMGVKTRRIQGAGFLYKFLDICEVPTIALLKFVDEGDNTRDAFALTSYLNSWTKYQNDTQPWKFPFSWKNLFGPPPPVELY